MASIVASRHQMASFYADPDGSWRVQVYLPNGSRRLLFLGKIGRQNAKFFATKLENIVSAAKIGRIDAELDWISRLSPRIAEKLEAWGLIQPSQKPADMRLEALFSAYIEGRSDLGARTKSYLQLVKTRIVEHLGNRHVQSITEGDAERYAAHLRSFLAQSTAGRELKRCRQLFKAFEADRLIASNPFEAVSVAGHAKSDRKSYVSTETIEAVIAKIGCPEMRAVVALARYCGLRVPSEPQALEWSSIDWDLGRMAVRSPKLAKHHNATRLVPIFPEARKHLDRLWELGLDDRLVFSRYRSSAGTHYRAQLMAAITAAKLTPWPKLWMNLRASCRTDLEQRFPNHVCNAWLGHSGQVAEQSYLQIKPEDWINANGAQMVRTYDRVAGGVVDSTLADSSRHFER